METEKQHKDFQKLLGFGHYDFFQNPKVPISQSRLFCFIVPTIGISVRILKTKSNFKLFSLLKVVVFSHHCAGLLNDLLCPQENSKLPRSTQFETTLNFQFI